MFRSVPTWRVIENSKKIAKKFKKKKPLWLHFKPKSVERGWEREKIKIIVSFRSYLTRNRKFLKNSKEIQKIRKDHYGFSASQNRMENAEKGRKLKLSFRSVSTRHVIKNSKKIEKILKNKKNTVMASFQAKIVCKRPRKRENKNYRFVSFLPDV